MPRGIYKRKKVGRSKGRKNKILTSLEQALDWTKAGKKGTTLRIRLPNDFKIEDRNKLYTPTEPPSYLSRLEAATVKYEQAINEAISALKGQ